LVTASIMPGLPARQCRDFRAVYPEEPQVTKRVLFSSGTGSSRPPALRRAIELALADAGLEPRDVSVVFADAAGVPALDRAEAIAISAVFGPLTVQRWRGYPAAQNAHL
jgi:3-oxoacyl-(acyl-carrier-protein) synthase